MASTSMVQEVYGVESCKIVFTGKTLVSFSHNTLNHRQTDTGISRKKRLFLQQNKSGVIFGATVKNCPSVKMDRQQYHANSQ